MEQNEVSESSKSLNRTDLGTGSSLFSELIPAYLEYVRVEQGRPPITVERYRARLQRFSDELGDCPVGEITPAKLSLYKRHLMDAGLGPVTIGGFLSCLRGFLRYLRDVQGFLVSGNSIPEPTPSVERHGAEATPGPWSGAPDPEPYSP